MSALTPFGKALRKLRIEKELRLYDLAEKLGKSTALISAIETGRKSIPDGFILALSRALELGAAETKSLRSAAEQTRKEVRVDHLRAEQRELVSAFARRMDDVPANIIDGLRKSVLKAENGESPFQRKRRGMLVPPKSIAAIEKETIDIRRIFCGQKDYEFPIMKVIEFILPSVIPAYIFDIRTKKEMDGDEGRMVMGKHILILRDDVYEGACRGEPRHRFTACHEFAHYVLHHHLEPSLARARGDEDPVYRDAEWQADIFAGTLMLSREHAEALGDYETAACMCRMSNQAARVTYSKYGLLAA
jgi:Zn-dependent peptidase ImmA (M78 family)/transcriptional regulator with XRE-family HTH domain